MSSLENDPENDEDFDEELNEEEERSEGSEDEQPQDKVSQLLRHLQSSGALVKKSQQIFKCMTCEITFPNWDEQEQHLRIHVTLPSVVLEKLLSDDESEPDFEPGDEPWSDEEEATLPGPGQKIDISQILNNPNLCVKKATDIKSSDDALSKLSNLGLIKQSSSHEIETGVKTDPDEEDLMQKIGKLGGLKLKLKTDDGSQSFKVVNGLNNFKTNSEEEDDDEWNSGDDKDEEDVEKLSSLSEDGKYNEDIEESEKLEEELGKSQEQFQSHDTKPKITEIVQQEAKRPIILQKSSQILVSPSKNTQSSPSKPQILQQTTIKPPNSTNMSELKFPQPVMENVAVKTEEDNEPNNVGSQMPLFSGQIKNERTSPVPGLGGTVIKTEAELSTEPASSASSAPLFSNHGMPTPLPPVTKQDPEPLAIIELNGDSNDEDDDCCVVSETRPTDVKPVLPKTEQAVPVHGVSSAQTFYPAHVTSSQASGEPSILSSRLMTSAPSTEKQHCFNWNAPDTKPAHDLSDKSADAIFESLLASTSKKDTISLSEASEYISLDRLGPQHTCEVCNTRFTDVALLENHQRMTGHARSLVPHSSAVGGGALLPAYSAPSSLISSLLPMKQLAEQVGKLSAVPSPFTHQQNVMINIQAYPGPGQMGAPYPQQPAYQGMYRQPGPQPGQPYPGAYPQQPYSQYQPPMSQPGYPSSQPYPTPYSVAGQPAGVQTFSPQNGSMSMSMPAGHTMMGPPVQPSSPSQQYQTSSSPNSQMRPPAPPGPPGIRIQNVQGAAVRGAMSSRGAGRGGRLMGPGGVRGARPTVRAGVQVHGGGARGAKVGPRMPLKRPGPSAPSSPQQKRRMDMLLPGKHDNEDCQVMSMQKQRDGLPMIHSVQGSKDKLGLSSQITVTKKTVNKEASAMANVLAARGISVKAKAKSRSPSPERPLPHLPQLGAGVSIKHAPRAASDPGGFTIPEARVGGGMLSCRVCNKMFSNGSSLDAHMSSAHPGHTGAFKCDLCPASYSKAAQLQTHRREFHGGVGAWGSAGRELGLPVVDLAQESTCKRLAALGVAGFIPLANREQAAGCYGIPVLPANSAASLNGLRALSADGLLSLGPLKPLPNT